MIAVEDLVEKWIAAKAAEAEAEARRVLLGNQIAALLGAPSEGSQTHDVGARSVTVKQPVNRKVDWAAFDAIDWPEGEHQPVTIKRELDAKGMRWIQDNRPELYRELAKAITATPGRVAIEVKDK